MTYLLLTGEIPFEADDTEDLVGLIKKCKIRKCGNYSQISDSAKDFIGKLL